MDRGGYDGRVAPLVALTRDMTTAIVQCELTFLPRTPIDLELARRQHAAYERCLVALGCDLRRLSAAPEMADSVFIEDTALVLDEVAIVMRPGADSRRAETMAVAEALAPYRTVHSIAAPATIDGGDVLVAGRRIFVGLSSRTTPEAAAELRCIVAPFGYSVHEMAVDGCLHLKSAVTALSDDVLLVNRAWVDAARFDGFALVDVDPAEPSAANALRVGAAIVLPSEFPRTRDAIATRGFDVHTVGAGELAKAEGGVTCCSLIFTR
jgi:dimethylargininase